ncbi:hypothetical protein [Nonomuraea sp. NPDC050310]|uniref:hypothetical protein n=1 Tax=Nonomuraea sp. NPDC050310 TaxID=3154935 RepID=UPI0033EF1825
MLKIPSVSTEYVKVPVTGPGDFTALDVDMAILPDGEEPSSGSWVSAAWIGTSAAVLIGPSTSFALSNGLYGIWVRITSTPEEPVLGPFPLFIT